VRRNFIYIKNTKQGHAVQIFYRISCESCLAKSDVGNKEANYYQKS